MEFNNIQNKIIRIVALTMLCNILIPLGIILFT